MGLSHQDRIVISGAGPAGSLLALFLASRGFRVDVFEKRDDLRIAAAPAGRSINLALSERGIHALRAVGLDEEILRHSIRMEGRMIHDLDGSTRMLRYGRKPDEVIHAVSRAGLNRTILQKAGAMKGIELHFLHELMGVDLSARNAVIRGPFDQEWDEPYDVLFGADGAGSPVRQALERDGFINARQEILGHGYKELSIPPAADGTFRLEPNALHIWPRGEFMLIALPNLDASFTCTLFLPMTGEPGFDRLTDEATVLDFFRTYFPDALPHLVKLEEEFVSNPTGTLGTIRCDAWHANGSAIILGDAAHAIVPFFGQGMNCAFEDCSELDRMMAMDPADWGTLFAEFESERIPNTDAIARMALDNYVEMRERVADADFRLRRTVALELEKRHPDRFIPQYSLVSFNRIPYAQALAIGQQQDKLLRELCTDASSLADIDWTHADRRVVELFDTWAF